MSVSFFTVEQINNKVIWRLTDPTTTKNLLAVGMLRGAFMFFADLVRTRFPPNIDL